MKKVFLLLMAMAFIASAAFAATCSVSISAPAIDGEDIANYAASTGTDKWWPDNNATGSPKGQTFTTDSDGSILNSITFEISDTQKAEPTKTYVMRLSTIDKVDPSDSSTWVLNTFYTETAIQDTAQWIGTDKATSIGVDAAPFMTWSFDAPVTLAGNTEYALDIGMTDSTSSWSTGIPYIKRTADEYAGGTRYMSGTAGGGIGDTTMNNVSGDRVFHLDMTAVPEPATLALLGLGGLLIRRKR